MKRNLIIMIIAFAATVAFSSCAVGGRYSSQRGGGCHVNQGFIGYGGR